MEGFELPPEVVTDFLGIPDDGFKWVGPRLLTVFQSVNRLARFPFVPGFDTVMAKKQEQSIHAAVADGEEYEQVNNYDFAAKSYHFATTLVQMSNVVDLDMLVDLLYKESTVLFKMGDLPGAFDKVCMCVELKPDFLKGYTMQSILLQKYHGTRAFPAFLLLSALEHCQLTTDEQADLIVEASRLLAMFALDRARGKDLPTEQKGIEQLETSKSTAKLPELKSIWDQVFQKLYCSQDFAAIALLAVGLPAGDISHLNSCASNMDVDCTNMMVEQVFESLSPSDVETWGDRLAIFIVDHGGGVSRQTEEPLGVSLVRLTLKHKSLVFLQHVLQTKKADDVNINRPNPQGDTALHITVKKSPLGRLHQRIVDLLLKHGATTGMPDANGKTADEYVDHTSVIFKRLHGQVTGLEEHMASLTVQPPTPHHPTRPDTVQAQTNATVERLKSEGKRALQAKDFHTALDCYKDAVTELEKTGSNNTARDLAVLYCNMAAVYTSMMNTDSACSMAKKKHRTGPYVPQALLASGKDSAGQRTPPGGL